MPAPLDREWLRKQCSAYRQEFPIYEKYADSLQRILKAACRITAPTATVTARAKTLSSFADKAARKASKYPDPVNQLTDLCGGRVMTETQADVDAMCKVIREIFVIDEANSPDIRSRLEIAEFGYLSLHLVVQLRDAEILGVPVPNEIGDRKAEIQVRTLLQHAWATISHDRIYKSSFRVPESRKRDVARVAALLEQADDAFGEVVQGLDAYKVNYSAYLSPEEITEEIDILEAILENETDPDKQAAGALGIARVAKVAGDWRKAADTLASALNLKSRHYLETLAEHGHALCRLDENTPNSERYQQGLAELDEVAAKAKDELLSKVLAYRAWAADKIPHAERQARDHYRRAFEAEPTNPFHLASYVEYEIYCGKSLGAPAMLKPLFSTAIQRCRRNIEADIDVPWSFFTIGRFHLLLDDPYQSLNAYASAIRVCSLKGSCPLDTMIDTELVFLRRLHRAEEMPESHGYVRDFLLLAKATRGRGLPDDLAALRGKDFRQPIVILAGAADARFESELSSYQADLLKAFNGFRGTLISGGTEAGVAGIAGAIAATLREESPPGADAIGYLPDSIPFDIKVDHRYGELITSGEKFGPRQPLQYWTDLLRAHVNPSQVRLLGINGGPIAACEFRIALALGAKVGVIESSGRSAAEIVKDRDWTSDPNFLPLPRDTMSLRAFVNPPAPALSEAELEESAKTIHEAYLEENRHKHPDPAMVPWEELREDLKVSNKEQAASAASFLERIGYQVRKAQGAIVLPTLSEEEIEKMAEMEHGRWVVERLRSGWRYARDRDAAKKLSPYLVPWEQLPDNIKEYDRIGVRNWPEILRTAGFEVVR
jgi:ppGpp synthetase/RelA/SpoT-type nucleotidyltranferase